MTTVLGKAVASPSCSKTRRRRAGVLLRRLTQKTQSAEKKETPVSAAPRPRTKKVGVDQGVGWSVQSSTISRPSTNFGAGLGLVALHATVGGADAGVEAPNENKEERIREDSHLTGTPTRGVPRNGPDEVTAVSGSPKTRNQSASSLRGGKCSLLEHQNASRTVEPSHKKGRLTPSQGTGKKREAPLIQLKERMGGEKTEGGGAARSNTRGRKSMPRHSKRKGEQNWRKRPVAGSPQEEASIATTVSCWFGGKGRKEYTSAATTQFEHDQKGGHEPS